MADYVALNTAQAESEIDPFTPTRYRQFERWLPRGAADVLDVGCNTGRGGAALKAARPALRLVGLDLLASRLERLPRHIYSGVLCGSAAQIPCDDASFDALVAGEFIEHLPNTETMPFLQEAFRVLRIGGVLLLTTPNPRDWKLRWRGGSVLGGSHVSQHHAPVLRTQLMMAGFNDVVVRGTGKVSAVLGTHVPLLNVYGSYLIRGRKH